MSMVCGQVGGALFPWFYFVSGESKYPSIVHALTKNCMHSPSWLTAVSLIYTLVFFTFAGHQVL